MQSNNRPRVILIHGFASAPFLMWPLAFRLRQANFDTSCFGYASFTRSIPYHGQNFRDYLIDQHEKHPSCKLHIVAHSMGGIVTRQALATCPDDPLDFVSRIIMLGVPQKGSPVAQWLTERGFGFIHTLGQLSNRSDSHVNRLPSIAGPQIGTIAASYDFVVPIESGHASNEAAYTRPFSGHNGLLVRPKVAKLAIQFLKEGSFSKANPAAL